MSSGHSDGRGTGSRHAPGDAENPWAGQGAVVLDIGGDVGALVVEMPVQLVGTEVEIGPADRQPSGAHPHVAVVSRRVGAGTVPSLVFPELRTGTYELFEKGTREVALTVRIEGGQVTEAVWPVNGTRPQREDRSPGP